MRISIALLVLAACYQRPIPSARRSGFSSSAVASLRQAIADARATVRSDRFHRELAQLDRLRVSAHGATMTGAEVDMIYAGDGSDQARPTFYFRGGLWQAPSIPAVTGIEGSNSVTYLDDIVVDRAAGDLEARACAINTLAHEWTHTIVKANTTSEQLFTDNGYKSEPSPIVSYSVGAVAQCVYLAQNRPLLDVQACVRAAGTYGFQSCTCASGWVDAFIAGDTTCRGAGR